MAGFEASNSAACLTEELGERMSNGEERGGNMRRLTRPLGPLLTVGALTAGLLGSAVAVAPSAAASTYVGHCSHGSKVDQESGQLKVPVTPYKGSYSSNCWMDYGSTGNGVKVLQLALRSCYGRSIAVDGVFGAATRNALKYAQGREGITVDGLYGEQAFFNLKWPKYTMSGARNGCARWVSFAP
ncbi:peptidoglycan-binding domain-containing protein [Streptomyces sp. UG1]|uniref:peptidoglycan-binding domain-containing protein n=1 Tax=Streptomyces sp. UG1 TaxID=3417652 RepID=UPI003CFA5EF8